MVHLQATWAANQAYCSSYYATANVKESLDDAIQAYLKHVNEAFPDYPLELGTACISCGSTLIIRNCESERGAVYRIALGLGGKDV